MGRPRKPGPRGPSHTPPAPSSPPPCQARGGDAIFPDPPSPPGDGSEDQRLLLERLAEVTGLTPGQVKRGLRFLHRDGPEAAARKLEACPDCPRRSRYAEAGAVAYGQKELRRRVTEVVPSSPAPLLRVDPARGTCSFHGQPLDLSLKCFQILVLLAQEAQAGNGWVSRDRIFQQCWHDDWMRDLPPNDSQLSRTVGLVRRKLREAAGVDSAKARQLLQRKTKVGYRLTLHPAQIDCA